jgi:hypothetical protein
MNTTTLAALAVLLALPASAQQTIPSIGLPATWLKTNPTEGRIDAQFTWSAVDLASLPAGETETLRLREAHIVITARQPGIFDRLGGRCLFLMRAVASDYSASGSCLLADADGDTIFERFEEASGKGHAVITGGTGKFAGLTGEYDLDTSARYASVTEGMDQGVGTKTGVWRRSGS